MHVRSLDHIVLCVRDVAVTCRFYERVLGMQPREERPGKWSLHFGQNKISLQDAGTAPGIAADTVPGSGNFCLLSDVPIAEVVGASRVGGRRDRRRPRRARRRDRSDLVGLFQGSRRQSGRSEQPAVTVFIVLFRGVGGATQLPTKPLREALGKAGFGNVATYINSGNAVLSSDRGIKETTAEIAAICRKEFGFEKDIMLVTRADWAKADQAESVSASCRQADTLHAFVLNGAPKKEAVEALIARAASHEHVVVKGKVLYFHAPEGFGISKLPPVIDRMLGVISTARNWNTVLKLMELAEKTS